MPWPNRIDYTQAVGNFPHVSILDSQLRIGTPQRGSNNYLLVYSGGFSTVFPIEVLSNTYALRCWIADIGEAETRYKEISVYLKQCGLPYFVDFAYIPEGILVNGIKYPIIRMEWADGDMLCDFINQNLQDSHCLKSTAEEFKTMVATLHAHQISHGDLQDGNILLKRNGADVEIKLIDYDSVFVPALRGQPDEIVGVPAFQHPQRIAGGGSASEKVDYFSELVIYLSLLSLSEKPDLWNQFGAPTEKRLLFTVEDFKNPDQSDLFRELSNLSSDVKHLASKLNEFCKLSTDQLEPLEAVLPKTSPSQAAYDQGLTYLHGNRYNEAIVEFEKATVLDPNHKEAHHGLGLAHLQMSNFGAAKKAAEAALSIDIHYQPAHQLLDAIISSTNIPILNPPSPSKKPANQTPSKSASQPASPKSSPAQDVYDLGLALLHSNRYDEAIVEFEKAIGLNPNYKEAHHGLGLAHFQMSNFGKARKAAKAALSIDIHYQPALQLLDAITSSTNSTIVIPPSPSKNPSGPAGSKSTSHSSPSQKLSKPTPAKSVTQVEFLKRAFLHRWRWITGALVLVLVVWIVVFFKQMSAKDEALRQNQQLKIEVDNLENRRKSLEAKNQTLKEEKHKLQEQLANLVGLDTENAQLSSEIQELRTDNMALRRRLEELSAPDTRQVEDVRSISGELLHRLTGHTGLVYRVAFSPDGQTLASASWDDTVRLWDGVHGVHRRTLTGHTSAVCGVEFSPDGRTLASGSYDKTVCLWDVITGAHLQTLTGHTDWVYAVTYSPDGGTLASGSDDTTIRLWDVTTGRHRETLTGHTAGVYSVAYSPDGLMIASGGMDNTIRLWDAHTGAPQRTLAGHNDWVYAITFSPDGRALASASWDHSIRLWDVFTGTHEQTLTGHTAGVYCVAFSPDGRTLASASWDHSIRLWDSFTGTHEQTLTGHTAGVYCVAFSPDGRKLASASWDHTIRLID